MRDTPATLGAIVRPGSTRFEVWAPEHDLVELAIVSRSEHTSGPDRPATLTRADALEMRPLQRRPAGYWVGDFADLPPGTLYKLRINRNDDLVFPDPASRFQPAGVHGPSCVVDPSVFPWTDQAWRSPPFRQTVLYELHVGTFSAEGTFRGAIEHLPHLSALGVTAIELMPVGDFPGDRNWGYDGVAIYAPARCYGTPDDLRLLVDRAHAHGLAVYLDVVYNHFGPDGAYAVVFSPYYFTDAHQSPWGRGVNLDGPHSRQVRDFFIENALHWIREYHVDGLRLDATHALQDESERHFLEELTATVRAKADRRVELIAEDHRRLPRLIEPPACGGFGLSGVWADDFHHQVRVHTAHDHEGYYAAFRGTAADIAATLRRGWFMENEAAMEARALAGDGSCALLPEQFVICIQNHDQIGNRADGARLHHEIDLATYRALSVLLLLAPETPLLFMGQEWAATSPFQFFTDHHEELGRLVTSGRRQEFRAFAAFSDEAKRALIPDPQHAATFARSRLRWDDLAHDEHRGVFTLYRRTLQLRRAVYAGDVGTRFEATARGDSGIQLHVPTARLLVVVHLGEGEASIEVPAGLTLHLTTEDADVTSDPRPIRVGELAGVAASRSAKSAIAATRPQPRGRGLELHFSRPGAVVMRPN